MVLILANDNGAYNCTYIHVGALTGLASGLCVY